MEKLPINNLGDLKLMSEVELKKLASTIRNNIIETVSETGGHLSSNLGIVELTIAFLDNTKSFVNETTPPLSKAF